MVDFDRAPANIGLNEESGLARGAVVATLGTALSRITGFIRLAALIYALGIAETRLTDTYNLANTAPNMIYELALGGVLSGVVLRLYVEVRDRDGREEAWKFITRLTNVAMLFLGVVALVGAVVSPLIINAYTFLAPQEVRASQRVVGTILLIIFIPQIVFYGLNTIATAVLRGERRFGVFMFAPVANNLIVIATFVLFVAKFPRAERNLGDLPGTGILLLGFGTTAGVALLGLLPYMYSARIGRRRIRKAGFRDPRFRRLLSLSLYTIGYVLTNQLGLWLILILANRVKGAVSARETAYIFFQLPHGLLAVSISMVIGTTFAERAVADDLRGFGNRLIQGLRAIAFVMLPAAAGYLAIGPEIVRFLFEHGMATSASTSLISAGLRGYAMGLVFFSSWHLMLSAFQGLGDTKTPMIVNFAGLATYAAVSPLLFFILDTPERRLTGLALGHAASYLVVSAIGFLILSRRAGGLRLSPFVKTLAKATGAAVATGAAAWGVARLVERTLGEATIAAQAVQILGATGAGLLLYALITWLLRMEEIHWFLRAIPGPKRGLGRA